jgi:hypothetical protein
MVGAVGGGFLVGATGYLLPSLLTVGIILAVGVVARRTVQPLPSELSEVK